MVTKHIEALQELFGDEWRVAFFESTDNLPERISVMGRLHGSSRRIDSDEEDDNAYICHLIDVKVLEREDVSNYTERGICCNSVEYEYEIYHGTSVSAGRQYDPLTARLEALVKLKESNE